MTTDKIKYRPAAQAIMSYHLAQEKFDHLHFGGFTDSDAVLSTTP